MVIGGGYIGVEIGSFLNAFGTKVKILEAGPGILNGQADPDCVAVVSKLLKKREVEVIPFAKAKHFKKVKGGLLVTFEVDGKEQTTECDKILVTVGRKPNGIRPV